MSNGQPGRHQRSVHRELSSKVSKRSTSHVESQAAGGPIPRSDRHRPIPDIRTVHVAPSRCQRALRAPVRSVAFEDMMKGRRNEWGDPNSNTSRRGWPSGRGDASIRSNVPSRGAQYRRTPPSEKTESEFELNRIDEVGGWMNAASRRAASYEERMKK